MARNERVGRAIGKLGGDHAGAADDVERLDDMRIQQPALNLRTCRAGEPTAMRQLPVEKSRRLKGCQYAAIASQYARPDLRYAGRRKWQFYQSGPGA